MRIVVDAMGGDYAPGAVVEGAICASGQYKIGITLVGDVQKINKELAKHKTKNLDIDILSTDEVIEMHEPAAASVRKKRNSSIVRGIDLLKVGKGDAFVSAGNTGAVVCAATLSLRMLAGIERPGISIMIPTLHEPSLLIDVGANINPKPLHLLHYAIMSDAYCRCVLHRENPK
ncbi:MAG TPA: phosphate--acyl-ACP acyltransferase, partial [Candidatus Omnitrophica bacterium]|nr:phosphate--acyl-ACP acyltransferase [Candidatus Omnitrophota bacterium]